MVEWSSAGMFWAADDDHTLSVSGQIELVI